MNLIQEILFRFTFYEISNYLLLLFGVILVLSFATNRITQDRRTIWIVSLGTLFSQVSWITLALLSRELLNVDPTDLYWLAILVTIFVSILSLTTMIGEYASELGKKDFDIDHIGRKHFNSTLNLSVLLLLSVSSVLFIDGELRSFLLTVISSSLGSLWFNHILVRYFLKEDE